MVLKGELAHNKLPKNPGGGAWQQKASDIAPKLVSEVPQPMLQVRRGEPVSSRTCFTRAPGRSSS